MNWLPKHICSLHLEHNPHKDSYETVEEYYNPDKFVSHEEWEKAVATDNVWYLQWYPHTPISFHELAASSLEALSAAAKEFNE